MDAEHPEDLVEVVRSEQERATTAAYTLESQIVAGIRMIRAQWVDLAAHLYEFHRSRAWETLGYETLDLWLAAPDIEMSRRTFYALAETYRVLAVENQVTHERLGVIDMTKATEILPAVRRGQVDIETALSDCEVLTRTDLRDRYTGTALPPLAGDVNDQPVKPDEFHYENCPTCGSRIKVRDDV